MYPTPTPYKAIADSTRREILDLLRDDNLTAGAIASHFHKISRPAVSKHLSILRRSRLVITEKKGREQVYRLNAVPLRQVAAWVNEYDAFWDNQLQSLKRYVENDRRQT